MNFSRSVPRAFPTYLILSVVLLFTGPAFAVQGPFYGKLRVHFIDAGYGDAIVIQCPGGKVLMVDAGEMPYSRRITGYLRSLNIRKIDWAVITHPHKNHFEGYFDILRGFDVDRILINGDDNFDEGYDRLLGLAEERGASIGDLKEGMRIRTDSDGLDIRALHPDSLKGSVNANSIVLWLTYGDFSLLLTGDIDPNAQGLLMAKYPELSAVTHVQIPHHAWPFHEGFASFFSAKDFFASTGENQWGFPDERSLAQLDGTVYRTDRDGTIIITTDGTGATIEALGSSGDIDGQ